MVQQCVRARASTRTAGLAALFAILMLFAIVGPAAAQNIGQTTGQIEGVAVDMTGAVLPGVTLSFTSPALPGGRVVVTGADGSYRVPNLPPGLYRIEATLDGFVTIVIENIDLRAGQTLKPSIRMSPGLKETVNVVASPVLDVLSTAASNNLKAEMIDELPKGRSWDSVVQLAPAVNQETIQGDKGISFRGASISENAYIVDGVDTTSVVVGNRGQDVVLEFIDEVQVKSGFVGAEYGGALGGIVNVVTKSGSNDYRGLVNFQFSGSALTVKPRQRLRVNPTDSKLAEYVYDPEDNLKQFDFGGTLGGRIVRDRVWFFAGWMPQYINTSRNVTFTDGNSGSYTSRIRRNYFSGKITARLANNLNANFTTSISPDNSNGALPALDGTSPSNANYAARGTRSAKYAYSFGMDWVASSSLFVNAFVGYHTKKAHDVGVPVADRYRYVISNIGYPGVPAEFQHPTSWETSPDTTNVYANDDTRFSLGATVTAAFSAGGRHMLRGGIQYARPTTYLHYGPTKERVDLHWGARFFGQMGQYGYWRAFDISSDGQVISNNQAIFIQDTWSLSRLTLNLGLRAEREDLRPYVDDNPTTRILFSFADKLAPRVGVAWDVRGDSTWKIYVNAGMFYDMLKHSAPRDGFGGGTFKIDYYTLDTYDYTKLNKANPLGTKIFTLDLRGKGAVLDPAIKPARTNVYDVGTEYELAPNVTVGVGFVHRDIAHANEDFQVQQPNGTFQKVFGNAGRGLITRPYGNDYPPQPKFERTYDGIDFQIKRRMANNWMASASYTYSRLKGNFDGLADPDQQIYADINPNVGIYCDYLEGCYTASGKVDIGRLSADRPHQFKLNGSYSFNWGLTVGAFFQALSGTPITANLGVNSATVTHPAGRGGNGRNKTLTQTDLSLIYALKLSRAMRVSLVANILNLFDQKTPTRTYQNMLLGGTTSISVPKAQYFAGYDYMAAVNAPGVARDPRFLMVDRYLAPRSIRVGARIEF